jgi:Tfp pilus assembly protein PilX
MDNMKKNFSQQGATSILLGVLLLSVLLLIGLGISLLMLKQVKLSGQAGRSVLAFYAAEAGAERCLYEVRKNGAVSCPFADVLLDNQASYTTNYNGVDTITSIGQYRDTSRKLQLNW